MSLRRATWLKSPVGIFFGTVCVYSCMFGPSPAYCVAQAKEDTEVMDALSPVWEGLPRVPDAAWESFEDEQSWRPASWSGPVFLRVVSGRASRGEKSLRVDSSTVRAPRVAFLRSGLLDLSTYRWLVIDVFATEKTKLTAAFTTGRSRRHYEPPPAVLRQGWNRDVVFDMATDHFKSERTNWEHSGCIELRRIVREVMIIAERGAVEAKDARGRLTFFLDNLRFVADPARNLEECPPVVVKLRERPYGGEPKGSAASGEDEPVSTRPRLGD